MKNVSTVLSVRAVADLLENTENCEINSILLPVESLAQVLKGSVKIVIDFWDLKLTLAL